ncbi:MAG TPA: dienelactone hydrolase family protein [Candidatus Manganitrophaceae bacterium]|nr:dienelactone hydrolase family protein [Candidatus Manganitrophaceae bacterium]
MATPILTDDDLASSLIEYAAQGALLSAFLCRPKRAGAPGVILLQEWWGLNDHIKEIAQRLAKENYTVLAPDLYSRFGSVVTKNAAEAAKLMDALSPAQTLSDLQAAVRYLKGLLRPDSDPIGVIGFCMGGSYALLLACRTEEIRCAVPFYGRVPADSELQHLSAPLLFFYGDEDGWITKEEVGRLEKALKRYKKEGAVKTYPGAPHAFFNNTRREVYDPEAAGDAWGKTLDFLNRYLRKNSV